MLLKIILAILLPPVAVYLEAGFKKNKFLINIILCLLFFIPGVIHALLVVFKKA
ncbi:MAG: YqaE/Pmp3 family membrane protein [Bacteroidota bacterium]